MGARVGGLPAPRQDLVGVAVEVADDGVDLGEGETQLGHDPSLVAAGVRPCRIRRTSGGVPAPGPSSSAIGTRSVASERSRVA